MSESGFTRLPPGADRPRFMRFFHGGKDHAVQVVRAPGDIADAAGRQDGTDVVRVQGRVTAVTTEPGSRAASSPPAQIVSIETAHGTFEVRVPPNAPPLQPGAAIEIEVQTAAPAETVTIRTVPDTPLPPAEVAPARTAVTPVTVDVQTARHSAETVPPAPVSSPPAAPPEGAGPQAIMPGQVVRFEPVPVAARQNIEAFLLPAPVVLSESSTLPPAALQPVIELFYDAGRAVPAPGAEPLSLIVDEAFGPLRADILSLPAHPLVAASSVPAVVFTDAGSAPNPTQDTPARLDSVMDSQVVARAVQAVPTSLFSVPAEPAAGPVPFEARILSVGLSKPIFIDVDTGRPDLRAFQYTAPQAQLPSESLPEGPAGSLSVALLGRAPGGLPVVAAVPPDAGPAKPAYYILQAALDTIVPGQDIVLIPHAAPGALSVPDALTLSSFLSPSLWGMMNEVQSVLASSNPALAQVVSALAPQATSPAQMPVAAMLFIAAVRGGDLAGWLGDKTMEILRRAGQRDLIGRLGQESGLLSRLAEPVSGEWRALTLPLMWQEQIHKVILHYRHDEHSAPDHEPGTQTRFLFDLDVGRMGKVQLDGLHRAGRLDLIVRTEAPFSPAMREEMRQLYQNAVLQADLTGELSFQAGLSSWVHIDAQEDRFGFEA